MKKLALSIILQISTIGLLWAGSPVQEPSDPENKTVSKTTNIHYTGRYCEECHQRTPEKGGKTFLKHDGNYAQLCRCHYNASESYIHPVDILVSNDKKENIPDELPLESGRITCLTCHDISKQCQKSAVDETSLRGAPYHRRTDFCYRCHSEKKYEMLNPHKQLDENGEIVEEKCLYCHLKKPDENHDSYENLKLIGDLEVLCQRCHMIRGNHSGDRNHMIKPSEKALKRMEQMREKYNISLPLDEQGKITCVTCHNPHEKGVIPPERPGAKGADEKFKHRVPDKMCLECHQM